MPKFTNTQERMLQVLSDGLDHHREELHECLNDDLAAMSVVRKHVCVLRKLLQPIGQDIVCVKGARGYAYRHVRLLRSE